jgi:hypothetical protein
MKLPPGQTLPQSARPLHAHQRGQSAVRVSHVTLVILQRNLRFRYIRPNRAPSNHQDRPGRPRRPRRRTDRVHVRHTRLPECRYPGAGQRRRAWPCVRSLPRARIPSTVLTPVVRGPCFNHYLREQVIYGFRAFSVSALFSTGCKGALPLRQSSSNPIQQILIPMLSGRAVEISRPCRFTTMPRGALTSKRGIGSLRECSHPQLPDNSVSGYLATNRKNETSTGTELPMLPGPPSC